MARAFVRTDQISLKSEKLFVDGRMDVRTDVPADGHFSRPMLLGRLCNS